MYKHLLLATDGSPASDQAAGQALELARTMHARLMGLHVIRPLHLAGYEVDLLPESRADYEANVRAAAHRHLEAVEQRAKRLGVEVQTQVVVADHPYQAILDTAREAGCDLIVMASHGRRGMRSLLLGSETQKVLTHGTLPVLVLR